MELPDTLKFSAVDPKEFKKSCALFPKPSNPVGEVYLENTGALVTEHYILSANKISQLDIRPDDVWVISFPRSGTTWAEEMIWLLSNELNYEKAKSEWLHRRFKFLELVAKNKNFKGASEFDDLDAIIKAPSPRFIKSHLPLNLLPKQLLTVKPKIFYIYRNPKDVAVSQFNFFKMIYDYQGSLEDFIELFLSEKITYHPYWNHVLTFWELSKSNLNVKLISYEQMNTNLWDVVRSVANTLKIETIYESKKEEILHHLSFESMKNNKSLNKEEQMLRNKVVLDRKDVQFLRKGTINQWEEVMPEDLIRKFNQWIKNHLEKSNFKPFYDI